MNSSSVDQLSVERWRQREAEYPAFIQGPLRAFWQAREEWCFRGVDNISIQCVRWTHQQSSKVIVIVSGFTETYLKYQELAYDLYQQGYDVMMYDHRGQGYSGRILNNTPRRVYVERFTDYVDDLTTFWQDFVAPCGYQQRYILGHSMGGAVTGLFLSSYPQVSCPSQGVNAVVLSAPMVGIHLPMPISWAKALTNIAEHWSFMRNGYVLYKPSLLPFAVNVVTHSRARYTHWQQLFAEQPDILLRGPTYHWVREAMAGGEQLLASTAKITTPLLLLQAGQERLVSNQAQTKFHQALYDAGLQTMTAYLTGCDRVQCSQANGFIRFERSRHEILFENDEIRVAALNALLSFFAHHH